MNQKQTGTTLEVLAPYLPHGVELMQIIDGVPTARRWPILTALQWKGSNLLHREPDDSVRLGQHEVYSPASQFLPVLRPFSALCDPLPDGTVPAVEVAKIQWPYYKTTRATTQPDGQIHLWALSQDDEGDAYEARFIYLAEKDFLNNSFGWRAANYLRSQHFAVGLEPHQFIEKTN